MIMFDIYCLPNYIIEDRNSEHALAWFLRGSGRNPTQISQILNFHNFVNFLEPRLERFLCFTALEQIGDNREARRLSTFAGLEVKLSILFCHFLIWSVIFKCWSSLSILERRNCWELSGFIRRRYARTYTRESHICRWIHDSKFGQQFTHQTCVCQTLICRLRY
jgi:hypothetical protein